MIGQDLVARLRAAGLTLRLGEGGSVLVSPSHAIRNEHRVALRAMRDAVAEALRAEAMTLDRVSDEPSTQRASDDALQIGGNEESQRIRLREAWFAGRGRSDAKALAMKLQLRDRDLDDRRLCLECTYLVETGCCLAAAANRIVGASQRLEPVVTILHRCEAFHLKQGLR